MEKDLSLEGTKYNAAAGMVMNIIQKMIDIANKKNFFVYEYINGTLLMIDPGMSAEEGLQLLHDIRAGKVNIEFYDTINDHMAGDVANNMEKLAKKNDFVISNVNGTIFRASKNMKAKDILDTLAQVRKARRTRYEKATSMLQKKSVADQTVNIAQHKQNEER